MTDVSLCVVRGRAIAYAREACLDNGAPRGLGDPVFDAVTQNRAGFPGYSACGDLCHYVLASLCDELGRSWPHWLNRDSPALGRSWRVGKNISALAFESKAFVFAKGSPDVKPEPGDVLLLGGPEHVCILDTWSDNGTVMSYDYGQRDGTGRPCARHRVRAARGRKPVMLGDRPLLGWLDLAQVFGAT